LSKFRVRRTEDVEQKIKLHPDSEYEYGEIVKLKEATFCGEEDSKIDKYVMGKVIYAMRAPITSGADYPALRDVRGILKLPKRFVYKVKFKNGEVRMIKQEFLAKTTKEERFLYEMGMPAEVEVCEEESEES